MTSVELVAALEALRARVAGLRLGFALPGAPAARRDQAELVGQLDDYLLPRLRRLDAPLLAVVGGSTGAGKSTLVNTLVGAEVSPAGVLRPTTRAPVLVCSPQDVGWFSDDRVLPGLSRTTGGAPGEPAQPGSPAAGGDIKTLRLVPSPALPAGLALLDAPDIDSVVAGNRKLAVQLLAAADLWIFVTTAARYADAVPWDLLHTAQQRSTALAGVLNRVPPEAMAEVSKHFHGMLGENGLSRAAQFAIPETALVAGRIPGPAAAGLSGWLAGLARDADARADIVRTTLDGALASLNQRVPALARQVDDQLATAATLTGDAADRYAAAGREVDDGVRSGTVLRGEVLARWQEFVGTGEFMRSLESRIGWLRDRVRAAFTGRPAPSRELQNAVENSVQALVSAAADRAAERTAEAWRAHPAGAELLGGRGAALGRASPELPAALDGQIRAWQGDVLALVSAEGGQRRAAARFASFGVNGAGLALMLAVFAQTGGLSGAEILVAGGTSAVSQKLLEAVFGDSAVRALAAEARTDLRDRVERLLAAESARFQRLVTSAAPDPGAGTGLRAALAEVERARRSARSDLRPTRSAPRATGTTTKATTPTPSKPTTGAGPTTGTKPTTGAVA